jgi:hypothetical protein
MTNTPDNNDRHERALEKANAAYWDCSTDPEGERDMEKAIAAYLSEMDAVIVPRDPPEQMLDAARHLMMWIDMYPRPTEKGLIAHCKRMGKAAPEECRDVDHVPPKALRTFWIYRAMLTAAPHHFNQEGK